MHQDTQIVLHAVNILREKIIKAMEEINETIRIRVEFEMNITYTAHIDNEESVGLGRYHIREEDRDKVVNDILNSIEERLKKDFNVNAIAEEV